jgi:RNA polymerase sigma-70 factor, ECF subfamily
VDDDLDEDERLRWERDRVERARRGDRQALGELYRAHADRLYRCVLWPRLGQRDAAEDALAETFRVACERLDQYEPRGKSIYFWLARIAMNKALDMHRARAVTGRALGGFLSKVVPLIEPAVEPEEAILERDDLERIEATVRQVLDQLNPRYARAIRLRFFEEQSRDDCARALDVTVATFDVVLLRALRSFKKAWSEQIGAPES